LQKQKYVKDVGGVVKTLSLVFVWFGDVTLITSEFFYLLKTGFSQFSLYFCDFSGLLSWIISGSLNNFKRTPVVKERKTSFSEVG
jgi:hypothetical protein